MQWWWKETDDRRRDANGVQCQSQMVCTPNLLHERFCETIPFNFRLCFWQTTVIIRSATRGHLSGKYIGVWTNNQSCSFSVEDRLLYLVFWLILSYLVLSYIVLSCPASSCVKAEETQSVAGARCYCVWILSVTVHSGRTKTVLRRQAWSGEQHRILLQTGQCLCQVLPSYTQQTLCSVSPHSQLCPVWLFFSPSYSLYLLYSFFLFRAGWLALESASRV